MMTKKFWKAVTQRYTALTFVFQLINAKLLRALIPITFLTIFSHLVAFAFASKVDVRADASFYSWRSSGDSVNAINQLTQDVRIRWQRIVESDLSLRLNLSNRTLLDGTASYLRIREAFIDWQNPRTRMAVKIGRCYPFIGSSTGALDGLDLTVKAASNLRFGGFSGFAPEYLRPYGKTHLDHFRTGLGLLYNNLPRFRLESYIAYELYKGKTYRQIFGFSDYISPFARLTSYNYTQIDLHQRKLSSFIAHVEYELTSPLSVFSEYAYRAPLIGPISDTQTAQTDYHRRLPVYREMTVGIDLRILSAFRLRVAGGSDTTWGRNALIGNLRLTSFDFLRTGFDVFAGYRIRNRQDNTKSIYFITIGRSIGKKLVIEGNFSYLQYQFVKSLSEYRSQIVGFNAIYRILHNIDISFDIESTRHGKDFSDMRIFTNVGYATK
ncbi:hypothetical protein FJZ31_25005 [Candidatus Poribacteria bacterium]|nr:hypothetical protein [Candidatus Poribacteria bacterium]